MFCKILLTLLVSFECLFCVRAALRNCNNNPCLNQGRCLDQPNTLYGYSCICKPGFHGVNCENNLNQGIITGGGGSGIVNINSGNVNNNDDNNQDQFNSIDCLNGGKIASDGMSCICPNGFAGNRCEKLIDFNPNINQPSNLGCMNGGNRPKPGLPCVCPKGFTGLSCEKSIDANSCLNGGYKSSNLQYNSPCICLQGFSGPRCEKYGISDPNLYCSSLSCKNNGQCVQTSTGFTCRCVPGYYGSRCEYFRSSNSNNKILGISLGSIFPFLFVVAIIGICIYCCCFRKKNNANSLPFSNSSGGNFFGRSNQQGISSRPLNNAHPMPDPDEVFKVHNSPPTYDQTMGFQKPNN